jgi:hypothetical protein
VGGRLQGLKRKKVFYTIREMGLRSSSAVYRTGMIRFEFYEALMHELLQVI